MAYFQWSSFWAPSLQTCDLLHSGLPTTSVGTNVTGGTLWENEGSRGVGTLWESDHRKTNLEGRGLRVNIGRTKVLVSGLGLHVLQKFGKDPCAMCPKGICTKSIFCGGCSSWVHKKCGCITGPLKSDASFRCKQLFKLVCHLLVWPVQYTCIGQARPVDGRPMTEVTVGREKLEMMPSFSVTLATAYPQQWTLSHHKTSYSVLPNHPSTHPRGVKSWFGWVKILLSYIWYWNCVCYMS